MKKFKVRVKSYATFEYDQEIIIEADSDDEAHDNAIEAMDSFQNSEWIKEAVNQNIYETYYEVGDIEETEE